MGGWALSVLDWWQEAGVDTLVDETSRDWLAATAPVPPPAPVPPTGQVPLSGQVPPPAAVPAPVAVAAAASRSADGAPGDLAGFRAWLLASAEVPGPVAARLDAAGDPAGGTMVVIDMPEPGDAREGRLLGGEAGALFDAMLAPMRLARDGIYLAPLAPARPAAGRLDAGQLARLAPLMRRHVALARPARLLLMGDAAVRALTGLACADARGRAHTLAEGDLTVPVVATFHPRFLVDMPARKAAAWADLKLFMGLKA